MSDVFLLSNWPGIHIQVVNAITCISSNINRCMKKVDDITRELMKSDFDLFFTTDDEKSINIMCLNDPEYVLIVCRNFYSKDEQFCETLLEKLSLLSQVIMGRFERWIEEDKQKAIQDENRTVYFAGAITFIVYSFILHKIYSK